jgi:hypothetical protein
MNLSDLIRQAQLVFDQHGAIEVLCFSRECAHEYDFGDGLDFAMRIVSSTSRNDNTLLGVPIDNLTSPATEPMKRQLILFYE